MKRQVAVHPVGIALALIGAAAAGLSIFLPLRESSAFSTVADNTLIQSGSVIELVGLSIWVVALTYRYWHRGVPGWGVSVLAALIVGTAFYYGYDAETFTLYSIDPATGDPISSGPTVKATPGIALYAAGFGGAIAFIGGWVMWRHSEPVASPPSVAPAVETRATKRCPACAEDVLAEARVCRYCGHAFFSLPWAQDPETTKRPPAQG